MTYNVNVSDKEDSKVVFSRYLEGQFSEHLGTGIYGGLWVGKDSDIPNTRGIRDDVVTALANLKVPVLRWPGGFFADNYHWREGIGPYDQRRKIINSSWGGTIENNAFGTHEYFDLCSRLGTESYININFSSGTIKEMADWLEYMMAPQGSMADLRAKNGHPEPWQLHFLGIGNESWGGGGHMTPEFYSDRYKLWQSFVRQYGEKPVFKIGVGPNIDDFHWTDTVMKNAYEFMDGLSLHHYGLTDIWENKGDAVDFEAKEWHSLLYSIRKMDYFITEHTKRMDRYDQQKRVKLIVDEWGDWLHAEKGTNPAFLRQQNTIRDAVMAATTLNIFAKHADRVLMANIAQTVNVLQSMILTNGQQMLLTPTYYVFDMYKHHQDATVLSAYSDNGDPISYTISKKDGNYIISVCNTDLEQSHNLTITFAHDLGTEKYARVLHSEEMNAHNTFDDPNKVMSRKFDGFQIDANHLGINLDNKSIITIVVPFKEGGSHGTN